MAGQPALGSRTGPAAGGIYRTPPGPWTSHSLWAITSGSAAVGIYDNATETDILLDALDYGRGDWRRAIRFLDDAGGGAPHDPAIAAAAFRIRALSRLPQ